MTDRDIRKTLVRALQTLTLVGLVLGVIGFLQGAPESRGKRFYLRSEGGAVLFEHTRHADRADACVVCHHDLAGEVCSCLDCHEDPDYTPDSEDHEDLVEYHERACDSCHEIAGADEAVSCRECHDDDLAEAYHAQCSACHLEQQPEIFAEESGAPRCRACHLR